MYLLIDLNFVMFRSLHASEGAAMTSRAVWAGRDIHTGSGRLSAISILSAIKQVESWNKCLFKPERLWLCDDVGRSFRKELDDEYKATRTQDFAEDYDDMFFCKKIITALFLGYGASWLGQKSYEADDVIWALSRYLSSKEQTHYILSTDLDLFQALEGPFARIMRPKYVGQGYDVFSQDNILNGHKSRGEPWMCRDRWDVLLFKVLVGDKSDNWKGMKGFGVQAWFEMRSLMDELSITARDVLENPEANLSVLSMHGFSKSKKIVPERFTHGVNLLKLVVPKKITNFESIPIAKSTSNNKMNANIVKKGDRIAAEAAACDYGMFGVVESMKAMFPCV